MGGHRQRRVRTVPALQRGQDPHSIYSAACSDLAEALGWDFESVAYFWSQLALVRMACGEPQPVAEYLALVNVTSALDRRGVEPD
jgi:hypothetical protein